LGKRQVNQVIERRGTLLQDAGEGPELGTGSPGLQAWLAANQAEKVEEEDKETAQESPAGP